MNIVTKCKDELKMLFYSVLMIYLFGIGILFTYLKTNYYKLSKFIYCILAFLPLFTLSALRADYIGNDTYNYLRIFNMLKEFNGIFENNSRFEIGYVVFCRLLSYISNDPHIIVVASSIVIFSLVFRFLLKHSQILWLSVFLLLAMRFQFFFMSGIRQSIAMAITLASYEYIIKRKPIYFTVCMLLAMSFHTSSFVFIILYPMSFLRYNRKTVFIVLFFNSIFLFFWDTVLRIGIEIMPNYASYLKGNKFEKFLLANIILALIQFGIVVMGYLSGYISHDMQDLAANDTFTDKFHEKDMLSFIILLSFIFSILGLLGSTLDRFSSYFELFCLIYIPKCILSIRSSKFRIFLLFNIATFFYLYNIIILFFRPYWNTVYPYKFFWQ